MQILDRGVPLGEHRARTEPHDDAPYTGAPAPGVLPAGVAAPLAARALRDVDDAFERRALPLSEWIAQQLRVVPAASVTPLVTPRGEDAGAAAAPAAVTAAAAAAAAGAAALPAARFDRGKKSRRTTSIGSIGVCVSVCM